MEIRFTASVLMAIETVLWFSKGMSKRPEGAREWNTMEELERSRVRLPIPSWGGGFYFSRITASSVKRVERVNPTKEMVGHWFVERDVEFYVTGKLAARVSLRGMKLDGQGSDNRTMWAVSKIAYYRNLGLAVTDAATDWFEFRCEISGYDSRLVEPTSEELASWAA